MGINGPSILVAQAMRLNPVASALFVCSATGGAIASGFSAGRQWICLFLRWLEADRFIWPSGSETITLNAGQLRWLLDGIDLAVIQKHPQRFYKRTG